MKKFEYQTLVIDTKKADANGIQEICNELGGEGWELVNVITQQEIMLVFKKEQPREFEDGAPRKPFSGERSERRPSFDSKPKTGDFRPRSGGFKPRSGDFKSRDGDSRPRNDRPFNKENRMGDRPRSGDFKPRSSDSKPREDKPFKADRIRKFD